MSILLQYLAQIVSMTLGGEVEFEVKVPLTYVASAACHLTLEVQVAVEKKAPSHSNSDGQPSVGNCGMWRP